MRISHLLVAAFMALPTAARADASMAIDYAIHASALSASISYCHAKYGLVHGSSPGGDCFERAKKILAGLNLKAGAESAKHACRSSEKLQTCVYPEVLKIVLALVMQFDANKI